MTHYVAVLPPHPVQLPWPVPPALQSWVPVSPPAQGQLICTPGVHFSVAAAGASLGEEHAAAPKSVLTAARAPAMSRCRPRFSSVFMLHDGTGTAP